MAEPITTDVFKFVAVRPAQKNEEETGEIDFVRDPREGSPDGRQLLTRAGRALVDSEQAMARWDELDLAEVHALAASHRALTRLLARGETDDPEAAPPSALEAASQAGLADLDPERIGQQLLTAFDALYVAYRTGPDAGTRLEEPTAALRALHFAQLAARDQLTTPEEAAAALQAHPLVAAEILPAQYAPPPSPPEPDVPPEPSAEQGRMNRLLDDFESTQRLLDSLRAASPLRKRWAQTTTTTPTGTQEPAVQARISITAAPSFRDVVAGELSRQDRTLLDNLAITDATTLPSVSLALENHLQTLTQQMHTLAGNAAFRSLAKDRLVAGIGVIVPPAVDLAGDPSTAPDVDMRGRIRPLGIGDLKVVKQKLLAYVPGEVAHIENVLKGEFKDRKHRVLDRAESILFTAEEESQETERDTQSTERFELKREAEKVVNEDMSVQAGVTVTGGFGPVTVTAHGDFAYATSKQDSTRNSANFARDVVDRSVSRLQKKTKVERTTKTLHEVEEINSHGLDNKEGPGHVTGVYRWVDKHYRAQVYNYGRRLMLEFMLPEPAAFFRASLEVNLDLEGPPPFTQDGLPEGQLLSSTNITPSNYQLLASRYHAADVPPPPPEWVYITTSFDQSAIENGRTVSKSVKDLVVPEGYILRFFNAQVSLLWVQGAPQFMLQIAEWGWHLLANDLIKQGQNLLVGPAPSDEPWDDPIGPVPVSVIGYDINAFAVNVSANCERTAGHYQKWQQTVFDKLYTAYKALQSEYDQKVAQAAARAGAVIIRGRNPAMNREIEKAELKKLCITMLTGQHFGFFNAMTDPPNQPAQIPEVKPIDALAQGRYVQFFEQAFDWEQVTYLFFPYFWGRKRNWVKISQLDDPDPLFTHFLQAGAARVVVPVSPAYNDAVLYFLESQEPDVAKRIWQGGEAPRIDDPLYTSIADELRAQTDDLAGATPEGEPWEFTVPTTLVWLQEGPELPTFE